MWSHALNSYIWIDANLVVSGLPRLSSHWLYVLLFQSYVPEEGLYARNALDSLTKAFFKYINVRRIT